MSKHGENIYKRKDGRWEGRCVVGKKKNGRTAFVYVYAKNYTDVKKKLIHKKAEQYGSQTVGVNNIFGDGTIRTWLWYWLEEELKPHIKQSSYAVYRRQLVKHLLPSVGKEQLHSITKETMRKVYHDAMENGLSVRTSIAICKRFLAALTCARETGLVDTLPPIPEIKGKKAAKSPRFLTIEEQEKIEWEIDETMPKDIAILLSLYSGIRVGECAGLKWENFDAAAGTISIRQTIQRVSTYIKEEKKTMLLCSTPKSESSVRIIPLPEFVGHILNSYKMTVGGEDAAFIFGNGRKPLEPRILQYHMKKIAQRAGVKGIHFHTLRHTFATRFIEKDGDIQTLSVILGHSSAKITLEWYGHTTMQHLRNSMQKLDRGSINKKNKPS